MFSKSSALALLLLQLLFPWLASCSEQLCLPGCSKTVEFTRESLGHFTTLLASGPTDPRVAEFQRDLDTNERYQGLCLKYIIGSVILFGKVNGRALNALRKFCCHQKNTSISILSRKLTLKNNIDTVARFVAKNTWLRNSIADIFRKLMKESWDVVGGLAMKSLGILRNADRMDEHHFLFTCFPVERQYEMIKAGEMPLWRIGQAYYGGEADLHLREIFLLARCSRNPDAEIRKSIADVFPFFKQCLADESGGSRTRDPCPDGIPELTDDALHYILRFMDVETAVCVMPLVCKAWRNLHARVMMDGKRVMDLYLVDLINDKFKSIYILKPWKCRLLDKASALKYFGLCIEDGVLDRIKPAYQLKHNANKYLKRVIEGKTPLPRIGGCATQYDTFVKLFGMIHEYCGFEQVFDMPIFLTEEQYRQVVYHFVYERRWALQLSRTMMVDDMPQVFGIIREDDEMMKRLVDGNFYDYEEASIVLTLCAQTKRIPDKLARLIFGHTKWFKGLVEPMVVPYSEYYSSILESGTFLGIMIGEYHHIDMFPQFLVSIIVSFRNNTDKIGRIEELLTGEFAEQHDPVLQSIKQRLQTVQFENLMASKGYSAEDIRFFKGIMVRCRLL